jgi:hypothetical protein
LKQSTRLQAIPLEPIACNPKRSSGNCGDAAFLDASRASPPKRRVDRAARDPLAHCAQEPQLARRTLELFSKPLHDRLHRTLSPRKRNESMNSLASSVEPASPLSFAAPILTGGVLAGALDLTYAFTYHGLHGIPPTRILQSIASGLLGMAAFDQAFPAALIGFAAHFLILIVAAAMYYAASRRLPVLTRYAYLSGMAFGVAIYCTMNFIVLPLSAAPHFKGTLPQTASDFAVHALLLGPAIALSVRFFDRRALR